MHHVIPRLKPGGRKTLQDGFETQGALLLFHNLIVLPKKGYEEFAQKKFPGSRFDLCWSKKHRNRLRPPLYFLLFLFSFLKTLYKGRDIARMELTEDMCQRSGREVVRARKLLGQVVVCRMGYSDAEVARFHGITTSAESLGQLTR